MQASLQHAPLAPPAVRHVHSLRPAPQCTAACRLGGGAASAAVARRSLSRCQAGNVPERGFFSEADPNAEVLPVKSGLSGDITKRSKSRWESDFIWNKDWAKQLDYEESLRKQQEEGAAKKARGETGGTGAGYLSLRGKVDLNSMDVDLSKQLRPRQRDPRAAAASTAAANRSPPSGARRRPQEEAQQPARRRRTTVGKFANDPPTRVEQRIWQRSGKYSRKVVAVNPANEADMEALAAKVAEERRRYDELKQELQAWAAGLTAVCLATTFAFYGRDVAASYGVGAVGGLIYLRLLNRSVDGVGLGGALGQPRLLIPVILALGYNLLVADQTGVTLTLLPMLLGFFTYKGAVLGKQSLALFAELSGGQQTQQGADVGGEGGGGTDALDSASVDRAFQKKMLKEV
ncbi:hypothetical protein ACK3TF_005015 [Chlorella vulgaris]